MIYHPNAEEVIKMFDYTALTPSERLKCALTYVRGRLDELIIHGSYPSFPIVDDTWVERKRILGLQIEYLEKMLKKSV